MRIFIYIIFTFFSLTVFAQEDVLIPYTYAQTVTFKTTEAWSKTNSVINKKRNIQVYNFERDPITSDSGGVFIATQSCLVEKILPTSIKNYSLASLTSFKTKKDFKIVKVITRSDGLLQLPYSIGYWAFYLDENDVKHRLIIINGIHPASRGLQFFIDCPEPIFLQLEKEITAEIRTLKFL
jgi:hypothetical protein